MENIEMENIETLKLLLTDQYPRFTIIIDNDFHLHYIVYQLSFSGGAHQ